jgi:hypothetical protein
MMLASGLFVPQLVTRDPESGEFTSVEGPKHRTRSAGTN